MKPFVHAAHPARVVFGAGALQNLDREIELLGATRALVISAPGQADSARRVADMLGPRAAGVFVGAATARPNCAARPVAACIRWRDAMIDKIAPSAATALADVPDGATVMIGGFGTARATTN